MTTLDELTARVTRIEQHLGLTEPDPIPVPSGGPPRPTGLTVTVQGGRPVLTWDDDPTVDVWDVRDELNLANPVQAVVAQPRSVRAPLKPGQRRRYTVVARNVLGESPPSAAVEVPAGGEQPQPEPPSGPATGVAYPGDIVGRNWYLTLPTGEQATPDTVKQPKLATYTSKYFELNEPRDGVVFRCWHGGATTKGSRNPRSELRECNPDGSLAWWPLRAGTHSMTVVGQVNRLTKVKPHVVLHQVHDRGDDTTVWRLEGTKLWITDGDNAHAYLVTDNLTPGTRYALTTELDRGVFRYRFNDVQVPFELEAPAGEAYFKAGCYAQTNPQSAPTEVPTEYDEVVIFRVAVAHSA